MRLQQLTRKQSLVATGFLAPSIIGFSIFYLIPFALGVVYSCMDRTTDGSFVGFANYQAVLSSSSFHKAATNTMLFTGISVPLMIIVSLLLALLLNQNVYLRKWLRTAYVLPLIVPVSSIVMIWQILFDWNGALNGWMHNLGFERIDWMKSEWAKVVLSLVYLWKNIGYNIILFLAGLQSIPRDYYETADLEGASRFRKLTHITLVYLTPTLFFVVLMSIINSFKVFRETYLIAGDYPYDSIYMLQHYMNNMFFSLDVQKLTAAATLMVICILVIVLGIFTIERQFRRFMD
ncbi:multiple sugar transport system permease protein [Paenibacillus anaericanus]|uniref:carbohydrate ABC transporter permease n=1 Tax=Paenibacillus anaericanus TaxID=170367 RepID=UPI00277D4D69|nr:sugar ABC transporter permease [Paenibacillus anaericanus]MDQ0089067.1 multiple sugar transport system permease protein [Paenibacillus anaericanus]